MFVSYWYFLVDILFKNKSSTPVLLQAGIDFGYVFQTRMILCFVKKKLSVSENLVTFNVSLMT